MRRNEILSQYGESVFTRISRLASNHDAIDLGQGYPGYPPPADLRESLRNVPGDRSSHQYAPTTGTALLKEEISRFYESVQDLKYDPTEEITVTAGATEALNSALMGLINPGDEVVVFEPVYDQYVPVARRAGAEVTVLALDEKDFSLPLDRLRRVTTKETSVVILNNPHNPTGKVFERQSLQSLVSLAEDRNLTLISDEVYEHLYFDDEKFVPLHSIEGARNRSLCIGSAGKTFDATGWKVGWAIGPSELTESLRLAHQFTTYCASAPLQVALGNYLENLKPMDYLDRFRRRYSERRHLLRQGLKPTPFEVETGGGTYFLISRFTGNEHRDDRSLVEWMVKEVGVAAIPLSSFYLKNSPDHPRVRFAFCKEKKHIRKAVRRLKDFFGD
ncbi:MAG: aminotransferase class I/II-fold pyridoxal phosphate-dependent enzyme [bacterium]